MERRLDMSLKLIVVKVGTGSLTKNGGTLDTELMQKLVDQIAEAIKQGNKIVFVTSGAVAAGISELGIPPKPNDIVFQQVSAATGQSIIMSTYRELFKKHGLKVAQILLTAEDLSNRAAYLHICDVLEMTLQLGIVPIINENDVTSTEELIPITKGYKVNFSDNDILSVLVANALEANLVIILSNVDGLYTMNPKKRDAKLIKTVEAITPELKCEVEGKSRLGRGGMKTKLKAAEIATSSGVPLVIANSQHENVILDILAGKQVGTIFKPQKRLPQIKRWIAYGASVKGQIVLNEGAKKAILKGASLLPVGVVELTGTFNEGDVISLVNQDGVEFAKGNPNYNSGEINIIKGLKTNQIKKALGYIRCKEIIARKNIHITECEKR
ncbi:MAG: glutamate 5-kinase [Candidatus Bathyarchaeota archaeon]|nr:glutamate 5-kinase [Candidatus Bathyarchaeum sp.]